MRTSSRNLLAAMLELEIDDREKGPNVHDNIQMVYVVGDTTTAGAAAALSNIFANRAPPVLPQYAITVLTTATVATHGTVELQAGVNGLFVTAVHVVGNLSASFHIWTNAATLALATTLNPTALNSSAFGTALDATAQVNFGDVAAAQPARALRIDIGERNAPGSAGWASGSQIFIAPGRFFVLQAVSINVAHLVAVTWTEVPPV